MTRDGRLDPKHFAHMHGPAEYDAKLAQANEIEKARQALLRKEATPETLAYARFLCAVANDATYSHGRFKRFSATDDEVLREYPFLADAMLAARGAK
jgi:hypothetical protein